MVGLLLKAAINILGNQPDLLNHETASTVLARPSSTLNEKLKAEGFTIFDAFASHLVGAN